MKDDHSNPEPHYSSGSNEPKGGCGFIAGTFLSIILGWFLHGIGFAVLSSVSGTPRGKGLGFVSAAIVGTIGALAYFKFTLRAVGLGLIISSGLVLLLITICG